MTSVTSLVRANRKRVLDFEREMKERLGDLGDIEKAILSVGQLRSRWLLGVSSIDEVETETFRLKLDNIKASSELAALNLQVDKIKLEGHYEKQTLNFLINATKPLDSGETKEARGKALEALAKENLDDLQAALRASCDVRAGLAKEMHSATLTLSKLRSNNDNRHTSVVAELQDKISAYAERMKEAVVTSQKAHQKITGEYLILRHNARAAKEVLLRSQNEAAMARKVLQEKLDKMVDEATLQRERMEAGAVAELKVMTEDVRNSVIRKESEANELRRGIAQLEQTRKRTAKMMREGIKKANRKYDDLSRKRVGEVRVLQEDLQQLRDMVSQVEAELQHDAQQREEQEFTIFRQLETVKALQQTGQAAAYRPARV